MKKEMNKGIICQQQQFNFIIFSPRGGHDIGKIYSTIQKKLCGIGELSNRDLFTVNIMEIRIR